MRLICALWRQFSGYLIWFYPVKKMKKYKRKVILMEETLYYPIRVFRAEQRQADILQMSELQYQKGCIIIPQNRTDAIVNIL